MRTELFANPSLGATYLSEWQVEVAHHMSNNSNSSRNLFNRSILISRFRRVSSMLLFL